jgi:hypothetical protein
MLGKTRYILALDPAQVRDWSALAAVELGHEKKKMMYNLVSLERKQGLPYNEIVDWAIKAYRTDAFWREWDVSAPPELVVDATGVGLAVCDSLKLEMRKNGPHGPKPVVITSGNNLSHERGVYHVGKARIVGDFLAAFDAGRVQINPNMPRYPALEKEMLSFRAELNAHGARFEAAPGEHDDLLMALAMAVWYGEDILRMKKVPG